MKNKKAQESPKYLGGKTINVVLGIVVALFIIFIIGKFAYSYVQQETDLQKAGKQLENIAEKIEFVREEVSDSLVVYAPEGWYLRSDEEGDIDDEVCLNSLSCLCICENVYCKKDEQHICTGFDFEVEVDELHTIAGVVGPSAVVNEFSNTIQLSGFDKLRFDLISRGDEIDKVRIRREK